MNKRVLIVDFAHQVYTYYHSNHRLSARVMIDGQVIEKDTTVQSGCIKNIHRWSKGGVYPTAICFDRPVASRKAFWQNAFPEMKVGSGNEYKGNREAMPDAMFEAITDCEKLLSMAGVSCYSRRNYEADDLVFACVKRAKEKYPDLPIDVVTNDADLLPLVDDVVSVFLRSKKFTWAESSDIEKAHYVQVTPNNFQSVVEDLSAYKGFLMPYNSLLLHKLLRGDASDRFKRKDISRLFPRTKYNAMITDMLNDDINFSEIFRYSSPIYEVYNIVTGEKFDGSIEDALNSQDKKNLRKRVCNSEELDIILEVLRLFSPLDEEQLDVVKNTYLGMNLNQPYVFKDKNLTRGEFKITGNVPDICPFSEIELQSVLTPLQIKLRM